MPKPRRYDHDSDVPSFGEIALGEIEGIDDWDYSDFGKVPTGELTRAQGGDPHDAQGHPVDYPGQDCTRCHDQFNRDMDR